MRKIIISVLIIIMIIGSVSAYASIDDEYFAGNQLKQIGVLQGYSDGSLKLENPIKRVEVATIMVRVIDYENVEVNLEGIDFVDVKNEYWGYQNIQTAYKLGLIQGYPDSSFKPQNEILYQEVIAMMVNTLGYKDSIEGEWPYNYINKAKELGIIPIDSDEDPSHIITRGEMALIVWDTLLVKLPDGIPNYYERAVQKLQENLQKKEIEEVKETQELLEVLN